MLKSLDLFSGIAGFALGFDAAGIATTAFCEVEPYSRRVLAERFPGVPIYDDVRTLNADRMLADGIGRPDIICGGFPCQDISLAGGGGAGLDGERSGLWREYARIVREFRPLWVVAENSPALRTRGADRVLADLEALGYACWPVVVGAVHAGAPHRRQRSWVLAHADGAGLEVELARQEAERPAPERARPWAAEPDVGRVAYGVPSRVDRIARLGNAVVPAVTEAIGRTIVRLSP